MKCFVCFLLILMHVALANAQELFPRNEPASSMPKGVLGVKAMYKYYQDLSQPRNMVSLRLMYGVTPRLSVYGNVTFTNHHGADLPKNLVSHSHNVNSTAYKTGTPDRGLQYPYTMSGIYLYAKYRFLSLDNKNSHFRMAAYADWSNVNVPHDETEPNLMDDTKGYGGGLITTYLKNHFAVSLTSGVVLPGKYSGTSPDLVGPPIPTQLAFGRALIYNLSFGYLVYPRHYKSYKQVNINLYSEFMGKSFEKAKVTQYGFVDVPINTPLLQTGHYVEWHPGIQGIFNSNLRVDVSMGLPLINRSYAHYYPVFYLGVQRYFFFK